MKILQFGFNSANEDTEHLPHNYDNNMVVYTGTHDNSTVFGFVKSCDQATRDMAVTYLNSNLFRPLNWAAIRSLYTSAAGLAIIPMQDIIGLDDSARMNLPGKVLPSNWIWRMKKDWFKKSWKKRLKKLSEVYFR
jgi:4-alpha-glucanotransferase